MTVSIIDGTAYITSIKAALAGLSLMHLSPLARSLPRLKAFSCIDCAGNPRQRDLQLPADLQLAAPYLESLVLSGVGRALRSSGLLTGPLPSWSNWQSLRELKLNGNNLTGSLPSSFATMQSLLNLGLEDNDLGGVLPAAWGNSRLMPPTLQIYLHNNMKLRGTIPSSWVYFSSAYVTLECKRITGCLPDGLRVDLSCGNKMLPACSSRNTSDVAVLERVKAVLLKSIDAPQDVEGLSTWVNASAGAGGFPS